MKYTIFGESHGPAIGVVLALLSRKKEAQG